VGFFLVFQVGLLVGFGDREAGGAGIDQVGVLPSGWGNPSLSFRGRGMDASDLAYAIMAWDFLRRPSKGDKWITETKGLCAAWNLCLLGLDFKGLLLTPGEGDKTITETKGLCAAWSRLFTELGLSSLGLLLNWWTGCLEIADWAGNRESGSLVPRYCRCVDVDVLPMLSL
jgi:hypothetical protein